MILEHRGSRPSIHESAYVAPTAVVCGDATVEEEACLLFGAVATAEGGPVRIGRESIVMEHAVVRGVPGHPATVGDHVLVGPHAHLTGCTIEDRAFLATGASVFNGAVVERGVEVRIGAVVHVRTRVPAGATVPIGWVAVGDPAEILPPGEHDRIWEIQRSLDFPGTVFGMERAARREDFVEAMTRRYAAALRRHREDVELPPPE